MEPTAPCVGVIVAVAPGPGLLFGLMLLAAIVGGHLAHWLHLPRVIGLVAGGAALRVLLYGVLGAHEDAEEARQLAEAAAPLGAIRDLALGLILFLIGRVFERSTLRAVSARLLRLGASEAALSLLVVFLGCLGAAVLTLHDCSMGSRSVLALLLGIAAIATAPAATMFVLQEYEAKGPVTDTILAMTGVNNAVCIVLFHVVFLLLAYSGAMAAHLGPAMAMTTVGSVVLGVACGAILSVIHAKLPLAETLLVFFALFIVLGAGEQWLLTHVGLSYNFLLTCLVTGGVFANVAIDAHKLETTLRTAGAPIFAGFFALAGYGLHLGDLAAMGWIGAVYVACRFAGKFIGCRLGVSWAGGLERSDTRLGTALLCQAAVVIGLASFVERNWDSHIAHTFSTVVLGSVVVFELVGPLLVKGCVVHAGEVKAITLLSRVGPTAEATSLVRVTLQSLRRLFGWRGGKALEDATGLSVEHIMRSSVRLIPASATFDEVLHFIERSTHSHFPVVHESGELAGMIHFSDVRDVMYDPISAKLVAAIDLADPNSAMVEMDMPLTNLLEVFHSQNVAVLPVVDQRGSKRIVGIVDQRDLLRAVRASQEQTRNRTRS
ncbi:MAG: CBS domain-containing protein [Phycisphaerae bacterium]